MTKSCWIGCRGLFFFKNISIWKMNNISMLIKKKNINNVWINTFCWTGCFWSSLNLNLVDVIARRFSEFSNQYCALFLKFRFSKIVTFKNIKNYLLDLLSKCLGDFVKFLWPSIKFMFSKKATKILFKTLFTIYLSLCSKCQIDGEDLVNFCGLLRKHELQQT